MTKKQQWSGKGLSRVEIAQQARDRAAEKLERCEELLAQALLAADAVEAKRTAKMDKARARAKAALIKLGYTEDAADEAVNK